MTVYFDDLGRLTIPKALVRKLNLYNDKLLITVDQPQEHVIIQAAARETDHPATVADMRRHREELARTPSQLWRFVRGLDPHRRVVLPQPIRELLGWTFETPLRITGTQGELHLTRQE